jgi:hypothetical protein
LGSTEIAEADTADDTNFLRENFCLAFTGALLYDTSGDNGAHDSASSVEFAGGYFFSQYSSVGTFYLENRHCQAV